MVGGSTSSAGKSTLVAAICRILAKRGYDVAPFKAQNMSLNSFVTKDGGEIAIAQAYQAFAAGIEPDVRMNPVLLKPKGDFTSQLVVMGKAVKDINAKNFFVETEQLKKVVREAYLSLEEEFDYIVIEGAGGMAEINIYDRDIPNIYMARLAKPKIIIVGDIDRGGVFASLYGTYKLLPNDIRKMVTGFVINRLRGYKDILDTGIRKLETLCGVPVLGVLPYLEGVFPSEDSLNISEWEENKDACIGIIKLPRISNFTDFELLRQIATFVHLKDSIERFDIVILPGSKDTIADLKALKNSKVGEELKKSVGRKVIIGICGGYQMLGREIVDFGVEHGFLRVKGFGLLDTITKFERYRKITEQVERIVTGNAEILRILRGEKVWGYEIHKGVTESKNPILEDEGCASEDGTCWGTYLHGLFWNDNVLRATGKYIGFEIKQTPSWTNGINRVSEIVEKCLEQFGIW
jgi:adenosylcobyric acid synthase